MRLISCLGAIGVLSALILSAGMTCAAQHGGAFPVNQLGLVPLPRHVIAYKAQWHLAAKVRLAADNPAERNTAQFLQRFLRQRGITAQIVSTGPAQIRLSTSANDKQLGREGYRLQVADHGAELSANTGHGLFYALQTFEQLFNPARPTDNSIHEVSITDWPRYRWRGIMLDSVRHFFPVSVVEKFIRVAAHYKLNVFHWHLTDDQGWRIQIPQYPNLTKIGAWRPNSTPFCSPPAKPDGPRYGGYYTDAQIREIVAYARQRYVTVVPEIDIPGHSRAAIASYLWLADAKTMPPINTPLAPDARTFKFLTTVFGDLTSLFSGRFIHLGGDEVNLQAWLHDPAAESLMQQRHWSLQQVHDYFARRMARFLVSKGRRAVVWNDVPAAGLPESTVIECWNSSSIVRKDAQLGYDIIAAESAKTYFDHYQGDPKYEPPAIGGLTTLRDTYEFNPSSLLPLTLHKRLLGVEASLWTEYVPTSHHLFYMLLPHVLALAEISWTPLKDQNYAHFIQRTSRQYLWLQAHHYNFRIPPPSFHFKGSGGASTANRDPLHNELDVKTASSSGLVRLTDPVPGTKIYYTLHGAMPDAQSKRYRRPISVQISSGRPVIIRGIAVDSSGRSSAPSRLVLQRQGQSRTFQLANRYMRWRGRVVHGKLTSMVIADLNNKRHLRLSIPFFRVVLGHGRTVTSSGFTFSRSPEIKPLQINMASPKLANHFPGRKFVAYLTDKASHLAAIFSVRLRANADYLREQIALTGHNGKILLKQLSFLHQTIRGAREIGSVTGSPVVAGNFFMGYENPMADNTVGDGSLVACTLKPYALLMPRQIFTGSCVFGVAPRGQLRRGFMAYLNMERCHPYRPFLHFNSWYDIGHLGGKYNQTQCLHAINTIGKQLVVKRGVHLASFLFDDGWDNNKTLWEFNRGFPDGFTPLDHAAARYHAGIGVWLSPWGGYGVPREQRLKYGKERGFETNKYGFDLAGPKYYHRFKDICLKMIRTYHVNIFKFDGIAAGAGNPVLMREGEAMLRLDLDLRKAEPNVYISQTTGTWASPFWLLYADSIWRGGMDHSYQGAGSLCQQWMTYRDAQTYLNIVRQGPLYPLNSLMLHGIIYGRYSPRLARQSHRAFADQVWSFFGTGTQLQELYITPHLLDNYDWNVLARAARWANANARILADTHWIGGNPAKGQIYGWASWHANQGILVLRNPAAKPATFTGSIGKLFQLPAGAKTTYRFTSPRKHRRMDKPILLQAGRPCTFNLKPFAVLVLQSH
ncbi:MAG: family 20 glycosylhydrolase [Planctomycetia bacterium]|nr:family 20 glycosylhydrolase [Planctomycetia bacterium]